MSKAKLGAIGMAALVVLYVVLLGQQGYLFLMQDDPTGKVMGFFILVLPAFGIWGIFRELKFGLNIEKLAKTLEDENGWPSFEFSIRPSGRAVKSEALLEFEKFRVAAEADPENWRKWFALGLIYDACGDRKRARMAMRKAIETSQR
jgi:tetratricopeptide (TPR) repeat protein